MRFRFSIPARLIVGLVLNMLLLALAFLMMFRAEFGTASNQLFATITEPQVQALAEKIGTELRAQPEEFWDSTLKEHSKNSGCEFSIFDGELNPKAGSLKLLPDSLLAKVKEALAPHLLNRRSPDGREDDAERRYGNGGPRPEGRRPPPPEDPLGGNLFDPFFDLPPPDRRPPGPERNPPAMDLNLESYPKLAAYTASPSAYWVIIRVPLVQTFEGWHPMLLVVRSDSVTGNGLFFDPKPWLYAAAVVLVISALIWLPIAFGLTSSLRRIRTATARIADGDFAVSLPDVKRSDELGELGRSVHQMAGRLEGYVTGQKRFLGDVAHELCSPLARMQASLGILELNASSDEKQARYLGKLGGELQQMSALVNELLSFSKANLTKDIKLVNIPLIPLVNQVLEREDVPKNRVTVDITDDVAVIAEPDLLSRAVANLIRNILRYAGDESPVEIHARQKNNRVEITIADRGPGVPWDALPKLFEPFFRPDAARSRESGGAGLGLAIVKSCIEACGGTVSLNNRSGGGLEVLVVLPAAS